MKPILAPLVLLFALPILAEDAPQAPAAPAPAAVAAVPAPATQAPGLPAAAGQAPAAQVTVIMNPVLEGDTQVALSQGTFEFEGHLNGAAFVPLVGFFASTTKNIFKMAGEYSETKAPANLKRIALTGYSPKASGMYGPIIFCKADVSDGNRILKGKDQGIMNDYWKPLTDVAKFKQNSDGAWAYELAKPLPTGHYVITFGKTATYYWDFDVK
jgi:hypothetical protein